MMGKNTQRMTLSVLFFCCLASRVNLNDAQTSAIAFYINLGGKHLEYISSIPTKYQTQVIINEVDKMGFLSPAKRLFSEDSQVDMSTNKSIYPPAN